jgi:hypothetical protein
VVENKMKIKRRRVFEKEFKQRKVALIKHREKKVKEITKDLGLDRGDIYQLYALLMPQPKESETGGFIL